MLNFLCLFFAIGFLALNYYASSKAIKIISAVAACALASLVVSLRPIEAGFDTRVYFKLFNLIWMGDFDQIGQNLGYLSQNSDYLYGLLNWIVGNLSGDFHVFLFTLTFLSSVLIFKAFKRIDEKFGAIAFALFISSNTFIALYGNALRQGLAFSFFIAAASFRIRRSYGWCLVCSVLSVLSHKSGFFSLAFLIPFELIPVPTFYVMIFGALLLANLNWLPISESLSYYTSSNNSSMIMHPYFLIFLTVIIAGETICRRLIYPNANIKTYWKILMTCFVVQCLFVETYYAFHRVSLLRFSLEPLAYGFVLYMARDKVTVPVILILASLAYGLMTFCNPPNRFMLGLSF